MPKGPETPNPKNADYQIKEGLIAKLSGDPTSTASVLHDLGVSLMKNPLLSNRQRDNLITGLENGKFLTYRLDYFEAINKTEEEDNFMDIQAFMEASLDLVRWTIEGDGRLQAQTIVAATQLSLGKLSSNQQVEIIAGLLNAAHLATKVKSFSSTPYEDKRFQLSFDQLAAIKTKIPDAIENTEIYDHHLASYFANKSTATNIVERYEELQEVIYIGFTMGVRDANISNFKLYGEIE